MQEADLSDVISSISISRIKSGGRMLSAGQFCPGFFIWLEIEESLLLKCSKCGASKRDRRTLMETPRI